MNFAITFQTKPALPVLMRLIHSYDEEVLTDACWAFSYLSDGTSDKIQSVIESGACPRIIELLLYVLTIFHFYHSFLSIYLLNCFYSHPSPSVLIPALRTVGNIVTGNDLQTQVKIGQIGL